MPRDGSILNKSELLHEHRRKNERWFEARWKLIGGPEYEAEFRFHPERKWRFDAAWLEIDGKEIKVALEVDGGGHKMYWSKYRNDVEKTNAAMFLGWQVFRVTTDMVRSDDVQFLENLKEYIMGKSKN